MVAKHEMPGKYADMIRPVGNGVIGGARVYPRSRTIGHPRQPIIPYPTGRAYRYNVSRHFMPGYHHLVPPGQIRLRHDVGAEKSARIRHWRLHVPFLAFTAVPAITALNRG